MGLKRTTKRTINEIYKAWERKETMESYYSSLNINVKYIYINFLALDLKINLHLFVFH